MLKSELKTPEEKSILTKLRLEDLNRLKDQLASKFSWPSDQQQLVEAAIN